MMMKYPGKSSFLVGSNHKTGTVWMAQIVGDMCRETGREFSNVSFRHIGPADMRGPTALFDNYSQFSDKFFLAKELPGFTVIRHPKDQIISATRYHCVSTEDWLHEPMEKLGGKTYQQTLNEIEIWEDKVIFEMKNASLFHTHNMLNSPVRLIKVKYEDLIIGYPFPNIFDELFDYLQFDFEDAESFHRNYLKNHILSGYRNDHVIDGSIDQWKTLWTPKCERLYKRLYGDIHEQLGYTQ